MFKVFILITSFYFPSSTLFSYPPIYFYIPVPLFPFNLQTTNIKSHFP